MTAVVSFFSAAHPHFAHARLFGPLVHLKEGLGLPPEEDTRGLGPALEAARQAWNAGADMKTLFGGTEFDLQAGVGLRQRNRPGDVFKLQSLLHREGYLNADETGGPTGFFGLFDHEPLQLFQRDEGLEPDGIVLPHGETIRRLKQIYEEDAALRRRLLLVRSRR